MSQILAVNPMLKYPSQAPCPCWEEGKVWGECCGKDIPKAVPFDELDGWQELLNNTTITQLRRDCNYERT